MTRTRAYLAAFLVLGLLFSIAAQTTQKPSVKKSGTPTRKKSSVKKATKKAAPRGQQTPTAERYKEIEKALADRGYLAEEPSGKWNTASVEALRSFQADHQLPPTGRLDALSLIQLGLGPKE